MSARADIIVLGAGMVGVSVALHLQRRGRDVALIDRRDPGEETSYGNAGLIQREAVIPYTFPREFGVVLSYAMNNRRDAVYHLSALPRIAPWLFQYWRNAIPERVERSMRALAPLMAQCVKEHDALIAEVGSAAHSLVNHRGWLNCCRTEKTLLKGIADAQTLEEYGVDYTVLTGAQLRELEPHLSEALAGAIHFRGSPASSDPGLLTKAYADLFTDRGGRFLKGDPRQLDSHPSGWSLVADKGSIEAREVVVARSVVRRCFSTTRLSDPLGGEARLPHALRRQGQCHARPFRAGRRWRLYARADEKGRPPDNRRRVR
jgi:D-amino-acid dehydrogenase